MTSGRASREGLHGTRGISAGLYDLDKQIPPMSRAKLTEAGVGS